jgi:flagellar basal-body rod protein FlgC
MSAIGAISAASSSLHASMQDLAASAHNIANIRTAKPTSGAAFQGEKVVRTEGTDGAVLTMIVPEGTSEGVVLSEPTHPEADPSGNVRYPNIDIGEQLVRMQMAQRDVELNLNSIEAAVDTYRDLLSMTNRDRDRLIAVSG